MELVDLQSFASWLVDRGLTDADHVVHYVSWVKRFLNSTAEHNLKWRDDASLRTFLSYLATVRRVAASTQNQAFNAILFMFREVLGVKIGEVVFQRAMKEALHRAGIAKHASLPSRSIEC